MSSFLKTISVIADLMTILGLGGILTYGIYLKDRNLFGLRIFKIITFSFRLAIIIAIGALSYRLFDFPYAFFLVIFKGDTMNFYWEDGKEIQYIFTYIASGLISLPIVIFSIFSIATSSLYYPKLFLNQISGGYIRFNLDKYKHLVALEILEASYGTKIHSIDVTHILRSMVDTGKLQVVAGNQLAGDPHFLVPKILKVKYRYNQVDKTIEVNENDVLRIP